MSVEEQGDVMEAENLMAKNLSSLFFDSYVEEEHKGYIFLRKRSIAITTCLVAHATYFAGVLNEVHARIQKESEGTKRPFKIGIIGCGRVGGHLIKSLLRFSNVQASDMFVSTHRPGTVLEHLDIECRFDNITAVQDCDLTFIACLSTDMPSVLDSIRGKVRCILYSLVLGYSAQKIAYVSQTTNAVHRPEYTFGDQQLTEQAQWDFTPNFLGTLFGAEWSSPLNPAKNLLARVNETFVDALYYTALNTCLRSNGCQDTCLYVVNRVMFRLDCLNNFTKGRLFTENPAFKNGKFCWKLVKDNKLIFDDITRQAFNAQYKAVFDEFVDWRYRK